MGSHDYSKEIYRKFYSPQHPEIEIFLHDGEVVQGVIVAVFHGNKEADEPYVIKWHIVSKTDLQKYNTADENLEIGTIVPQDDIEAVRLK